MKIGLLISGHLGFIILKECNNFLSPTFIATDSKSFEIIRYAEIQSIPLFIGNPRNGALKRFMENNTYLPEAVFSINYLFLLEEDVIAKIKYPINLHGSLLPKYRGRTPHVWAIINNEKETGVTAHVIDKGCDTGNIILQKKVPIEIEDTGNDILKKFQILYPEMLKEISLQLAGDNLSIKNQQIQDDTRATYFGKRSPEDGQINWNWSKERIKNWVRAQAYPYPGAYGYLDNKKVIIDKVIYSDHGFHYEEPNGCILADSPEIIIKTPNGAVQLVKIRMNKEYCKKGKTFEYEN